MPQENGHIETFHAILGACLEQHNYWDFEQLLAVPHAFYKGYNGKQRHGPITNLWPDLFELDWRAGFVQRSVDSRHRVKFKLLVPRQELLSGRTPPKRSRDGAVQEPEGRLLLAPIGDTFHAARS